jgi:hypothetical protein
MEILMRRPGLDSLVQADRAVNVPSPEARERNRARLAVRIAAGLGGTALMTAAAREAVATVAGGAAGGGTAGAAALARGALAKSIVASALILAGAGAGVAAYVSFGGTPRTPPVAAKAATSSSASTVSVPPVASAAALVLDGQTPAAGGPVPAPAASSSAQSTSPVSPANGSTMGARNFERELQLLRAAWQSLDAGSPARALTLLDRYAAEFPHGTLKSEGQAARVLALCAAGRVASAAQARDQFLKTQPGSPLAERVRTSCGGGR